ncbi:MAG: T9SS type A sorting domain-containing protein [Chloroflexi bacterium]|jgi:dienelactone hydrolase|nr:T9SS type A sorting domain-containing protein [Chloroflexota bacterium]
MKSLKLLSMAGLLLISGYSFAQAFNIGHTTMTYYDSSRNRNIETEIYYPADTPGDNVPIAAGSFPVIVFGHGFVMNWESYQNFWIELIPQAYVICFPVTEMSINPNHENFGLDLRFVASQMQEENLNSSSTFYSSLTNKTAIMGHSMGGGAAFLAVENDTTLSTLISFAAAETTTSAIAAATHVTIPALVFAGEEDCIAPPGENQVPIYTALASDCKTYLSINKGVHCYFADYNFNCSLGESFCNPNPNIARVTQQAVTLDFLNLWLDYRLKDNQNASTVFNDSMQNSTRISFMQDCTTTGITHFNSENKLRIFPNPANNQLEVEIPNEALYGRLLVYNLTGKKVYQGIVRQSVVQIDVSHLPDGLYLVTYAKNSLTASGKFTKAANH